MKRWRRWKLRRARRLLFPRMPWTDDSQAVLTVAVPVPAGMLDPSTAHNRAAICEYVANAAGIAAAQETRRIVGTSVTPNHSSTVVNLPRDEHEETVKLASDYGRVHPGHRHFVAS